MGFLENAALAASRGVAPADFAATMPAMTALLLDHMVDATRRIAAGDYEGDQATVDVHLVGARWRARAFVENGLQSLMAMGMPPTANRPTMSVKATRTSPPSTSGSSRLRSREWASGPSEMSRSRLRKAGRTGSAMASASRRRIETTASKSRVPQTRHDSKSGLKRRQQSLALANGPVVRVTSPRRSQPFGEGQHTIAPRPIGCVHRPVGLTEELVACRGVVGVGGHADADRQPLPTPGARGRDFGADALVDARGQPGSEPPEAGPRCARAAGGWPDGQPPAAQWCTRMPGHATRRRASFTAR